MRTSDDRSKSTSKAWTLPGEGIYCYLSRFVLSSYRFFSLSLREDYPLWAGSLWLVWNKRQLLPKATHPQDSSPFGSTTTAVDLFALGSILLLKKAKECQLWGNMNGKSAEITCDPTNGSRKKRNENNEVTAIEELRRILTSTTTTTASASHMEEISRSLSPPSLPFLPVDAPTNQLKQHQQPSKQKYVELLVHNVSHTDLILSLDAPPLSSASTEDASSVHCLCRPRFSAFDGYSRRIVDFITEEYGSGNNEFNDGDITATIPLEKLIRFPRYERSEDNTKKYQINAEPSKILHEIPVGFDLAGNNARSSENLQVSSAEMNDLRVRGRDVPRIVAAGERRRSLQLNAVFFPLLASLLPLWQAKMKEKYPFFHSQSSMRTQQDHHSTIKQVLILTSGVATPRNWTHSADGNSTFQCARLMKLFLQTIYPELVVVHIHSGPDRDILRYDENIEFVQNVLLKRIQDYRDAHAKDLPFPDELDAATNDWHQYYTDDDRPFSTEWRKSFSITLSFADGSPARNHAIQAALRTYRPTYYHFWQLKTFWHESKVVDSDVEVHSFEEMETLPPIETTQLSADRPHILEVVEEMKRFRDDMLHILKEEDGTNDIRRFWLRKTQKPVLAVLAVKVASGGLKLYRGTNMEVSMPTGSLCAERNVIGSALADNPRLKRQDLKLIAVLAVPVSKSSTTGGKNTANASFARPHSTNSLGSVQMDESSSYSGGKPPLNPSRKSSIGEEEDWIFQDPTSAGVSNKTSTIGEVQSAILHVPLDIPRDVENSPSASATPLRRISLYKSQQHTRTHKRTVLVHSDVDINPLRPCGACNEWLKKIAECNPYFTVITFTDSACNGVYCTACEE
ncbi:CDD/CDA-like deaminase [Nitzschia inconspicua]|uniref:CDD/CDA-like deaminase n=1 Tax=Nitzschia inconspicua TaxID=303405 RepID=A0A9K3LRC9_9STRA|nr:CDD/CDA-like deaminase [Nitzschia inconspicua]